MLLRIGSTLGGNSMAATVAADVLLFGALLLSWSKDVTFGRSTEGSDVVEGGVNESLQGPLQLADLHIELNVIPVELIVVVA